MGERRIRRQNQIGKSTITPMILYARYESLRAASDCMNCRRLWIPEQRSLFEFRKDVFKVWATTKRDDGVQFERDFGWKITFWSCVVYLDGDWGEWKVFLEHLCQLIAE
jgi:hypothetical protein